MTDPDRTIDPQLRRALTHAPDADLLPPASIDAAVLAAARAQAGLRARERSIGARGTAPADPGPATLPGRLRAWWRRPAAAPAFATVLLGTLVVTMWRGEDLPPAVPPVQAPLPASADPPGPARAGVYEAPQARARDGSAARSVAAPPPPPRAPATDPRLADGSGPAPAAGAAPAGRSETVAPEESSPPPVASVDTVGMQTPAAAPPALAIPPAASATAPGGAAPGEAARAGARGASPRTAPADLSPPPVPTSLPRLLQALQDAEPSGTAPPPAGTDAGTVGWHWRPDPAMAPQPLDRRTSDWLQRLSRSTRGAWQRVAAAGAPDPAAYVVTFHADDGSSIAVTVGERSVDWVDADGTVWRAVLPAGTGAPTRP
jgi:hypothetical protein